MKHNEDEIKKAIEGAERVCALIDAAKDMATPDAVALLENGREIKATLNSIELDIRRGLAPDYDSLVDTLTKLEVK